MAEEEIKNIHNTGYIPVAKHRRRMTWMAVIAATLVILLIGFLAFAQIRIASDGRLALREAKNIRLAAAAVDIEAYAAGQSIYAPERAEGLAQGVRERMERLVDINGVIRLTGYDKATRKITGFTYRTEEYLVVLFEEDGEEHWQVYNLHKIMDY